MIRKPINITITTLLILLLPYSKVYALELVVTGNGDSSQNEVQVQVEQETTVEQTNEASVSNEVETDANTGENQANANTGNEVEIQTGDIQSEATITNDLNTSVIGSTGCCPDETTVIIEGNGADSQNAVELSVTNTTQVGVHQVAKVANKVSGSANTGRNEASNNNGNVSISTGSITAKTHVVNSANHADIQIAGGSGGNVSIKISGNGDGSVNSIKLALENSTVVEKEDFAKIDNFILWDANTGENQANGNLGDVSIQTGDIALLVDIENGPINVERVIIGGCCPPGDPKEPYDPGDPGIPPSTPPPSGGVTPDNGSQGDSGNGGDGDGDGDGGDVLGAVLPATGAYWWLLALMANVAMFLMGLYLRLRSGRAPSKASSQRA